MKTKNIIISGGGTGGHIFPAIAIANAIKKAAPETNILFVGAEGRMEMEKVPQAGYPIIGLPVMGFPRKPSLKMFRFIEGLIRSMHKARRIIKEFSPDAAVGVGGYASGPLLRAASRKKIPCLIQEQNSFPGITNRLLAKKVRAICVAYDNLEKFFPKEKIIFTGNPVRQDILNINDKREEALNFFGLRADLPVVLSVGGSLGALTINQSIVANREFFANNNVQVLWQTGKSFYQKAIECAANSSDSLIFPYDFIYRMDLAFAVADVVISRAGASTISELCLVAKPAIFVPSPNVSEDHQTKNAMALVNKNAALMVRDTEAIHALFPQVKALIENKDMQFELSKNIQKLAIHNSADIIAKKVLELAHEK